MPADPKARAREAFADLDTPDKTAFVIEATFDTIGAALRETGERLGAILTDFDPEEFFRSPDSPDAAPEAEPEAEAKPKAKAPAAKTTSRASGAKKTTAKRSTSSKASGTKTAGRTRKKKDDDA